MKISPSVCITMMHFMSESTMDPLETCVNRVEFEQKMKDEYVNKTNSRVVWDRKRFEEVKIILKKGKGYSKKFYHFSKLYELMEINDNEIGIVEKKKTDDNTSVQILCYEDFHSKLTEAHLQTGHGGRDKMLHYIKNQWRIPRTACEVFLTCCETCNQKKTQVKKSVVVQPRVQSVISREFNTKNQPVTSKNFTSMNNQPVTLKNFNSRGQLDLIDFQNCPDNDYIWLLYYQDCATKFVQLRPLKSKNPVNVADELAKIFFSFGAPIVLQSENGREFVISIIDELTKIWPECKIVHGRPRYKQGSTERTNIEMENNLRAWMLGRKNCNWSQGCYELQWLKNTTKNYNTNRTPYETVLGPIHCGVSNLTIPDHIRCNLQSEEDLTEALAESNKTLDDTGNEQQFDCSQLTHAGSEIDNQSHDQSFIENSAASTSYTTHQHLSTWDM